MPPPALKVVSFDLTGTLLALSPSLGEMCADAMRQLGLREIPPAKIFDARRKQARRAAQRNGFAPISEAHSREYWRSMLWEIFAGTVPDALFPEATKIIFRRIGDAASWKIADGAKETLAAARFLGLRCVALSNGDSRWRNALKKRGLVPAFDEIFLSSETGFAKPDHAAFENLCMAMKIRRDELIHVGDSLADDVLPAHAIGAEAVWLTRAPDGAPPEERVSIAESLAEIPALLQRRLCAPIEQKHFQRSARNLLAALRGLPEEQFPDPKTIVAKKHGAESVAKKFARVEKAAFTTDREFVVPANTIDRLLVSRGIFSGSIQAVVRENWAKIVPAKIVGRCEPRELRDGLSTLVVAAENSLVRQELEFSKRVILKKIRALPACGKLKKIALINDFSD